MVKGYKVFNPDWTCQGFQYSVGATYELSGVLIICKNGFHFCEKAVDCFNYYSFDANNKVAEIIAHDEIATIGEKSATNKIEIVREIPWAELLELVNVGKENTGNRNSGNLCTGDFNANNNETGCFCTDEHNIRLFDEDSSWTFVAWRNSAAFALLCRIDLTPTTWVTDCDMSDAEKAEHPDYTTTGGVSAKKRYQKGVYGLVDYAGRQRQGNNQSNTKF